MPARRRINLTQDFGFNLRRNNVESRGADTLYDIGSRTFIKTSELANDCPGQARASARIYRRPRRSFRPGWLAFTSLINLRSCVIE